MRKYQDIIFKAAFVLYAALMIYLLFCQRIVPALPGTYLECMSQNYNIVPFRTVADFIHLIKDSQNAYLVRFSFVNLAGNIVMFVPLGFLLPCVFEKLRTFKNTLVASSVTVLLIELLQFVTILGSADIDDLILNLIGASLGYLLFILIPKNK